MQLSGEMAIEFIHANKEAIGRCTKIVKSENLFVVYSIIIRSSHQKTRAQAVHAILTSLIKYLGYEYLDAVLAHALRVFIPENKEDKTVKKASKYMAMIDKKMETITGMAREETSRKISQFFGIVRQATHSVVLFLEYFQASIVCTYRNSARS
ncbi:MAG: exocyst complex component Sec10 [Cytophagales bacterium]|nr:exocyst complex component Sec10 [Cytophagales bacterium]